MATYPMLIRVVQERRARIEELQRQIEERRQEVCIWPCQCQMLQCQMLQHRMHNCSMLSAKCNCQHELSTLPAQFCFAIVCCCCCCCCCCCQLHVIKANVAAMQTEVGSLQGTIRDKYLLSETNPAASASTGSGGLVEK